MVQARFRLDFLVFRENSHEIGLDMVNANTGNQKQSNIVRHLDKLTEDEPAIELLLPSVVNISVLRPTVTSLG